MKLHELLKHIPQRQYLRLSDHLSIIAMGYTDSEDIQKHADKTVGLIGISNGTLTVSVYSREVKEDDYRRLAPCLAMLKGFDPQQWDDLRAIHYGY